MTEPTLEQIVNAYHLRSDRGLAELVAALMARAESSAHQNHRDLARIVERLNSGDFKGSGPAARVARRALEWIKEQDNTTVRYHYTLGERWANTAQSLAIAVGLRGSIEYPSEYPVFRADGREHRPIPTDPVLRVRRMKHRSQGWTPEFGRFEFAPGRETEGFWSGVYNWIGHWRFNHLENKARQAATALEGDYAEWAKMGEFTPVELPGLDVSREQESPEISQEVANAVQQAARSAPFTDTQGIDVGNLAAPEGGPAGPGGGVGGDPDGDGAPQFLGDPGGPSEASLGDPGGRLAGDLGGGGNGNAAIPFRPDGVSGTANPGLIRPGGVGGGTSLAGGYGYMPGMMPVGAGMPPSGLAGAGPGQGGAGTQLVELDKSLLEPKEVRLLPPGGAIDSPPSQIIDDETYLA